MKLIENNKPVEPIETSLLDQMRAYQMLYEVCIMKIYAMLGVPEDRMLTKDEILQAGLQNGDLKLSDAIKILNNDTRSKTNTVIKSE